MPTSKTQKSVSQAQKKNSHKAIKKTTKKVRARSAAVDRSSIIVSGAREHNLKNVSVTIPRDTMSVITGLSGSGKSSLAFDVIYAESNRRYMESLSVHARMLTGGMTKPRVDKISHLSPAIAIDQKSISRSSRSTVGTMTEIYDYLRILYATVGVPHCPETGRPLHRTRPRDIVDGLTELADKTPIWILAPIDVSGQTPVEALRRASADGFARVRFNGKVMPLSEAQMIASAQVSVSVEVVVDYLLFDSEDPDPERLSDSVHTAMKVSGGSAIIATGRGKSAVEERYSQDYYCQESGFRLGDLTPRHFSFNNPDGACFECDGLGEKKEIDPEMIIPNPSLSLIEGAISLWSKASSGDGKVSQNMQLLIDLAARYKFPMDVPVSSLSKIHKALILYGAPEEKRGSETFKAFPGVISFLEKKYKDARSDHMRSELEKCMSKRVCPGCEGKRLAQAYLCVTVGPYGIDDLVNIAIDQLESVFDAMVSEHIPEKQQPIVAPLVAEITTRCRALTDVGVGYLTLARSSGSISGGEAQRIRLAVQIKSDLTGLIYVLDEPTTGLHARDTQKLIATMQSLRDAGNTLIVVEHDGDVMKASSWIVDMGPGAGEEGGEVIFAGTYKDLMRSKTHTAQYLSGRASVSDKSGYRKGSGKKITVHGATSHNLKDVTVTFPLGMFVVVCGVSGSGKSTLISDILAPELARTFHRSRKESGAHKKITGMNNINKVVLINQAPIGRTPRSNAATYTGVFAHIRDLFAQTDLAQEKKYGPAQFSFNMRGGRCDVCQGDGVRKVEMHLLPDAYVECESCRGTRYNQKTLSVTYNGAHIADVLDMSVAYALHFFKGQKLIEEKLRTMDEVGLGYLRLGQSATHLSGGEAQRIKLATELARKQTGKTMYILDEPTAGLHFRDTERLLGVLDALVDKGNSVIVVEHNLDVVRHGDHVIEMGPVGGSDGGHVVFTGTPKELIKSKTSPTAEYLRVSC